MALINQGFLGNASGKLGTVVFSKWRDLQTARQYQPDIHDANSDAQKKQRSKMVSLLEFLKPLNKNFIQLFNGQVAKGSTPWAKAIKDNMPAVGPDGSINPKAFRLGNPKFPQFEISEASYNPFIDQVSLRYRPVSHPSQNDAFPYIVTSVLGKYNSESGVNDFDTRHLLCSLPHGWFYCSFYDDNYEYLYENHWSFGMIWFLYYDTYDIDSIFKPNDTLTEHSTFKLVPIIEGFNTDVKDDLIPFETLKWDYQQKDNKWYIVISIDIKKTKISNPEEHTLIFWGVALHDNKYDQSKALEWELSETTKEIEIGENGFGGGVLGLYAVYTNKGEQVSKFNRFYINKGSDGIEHPYFDQLFDCNYAHPSSFILAGNQNGFCGNIDELFSEFIELIQQGYISIPKKPEPINEVSLNILPNINGYINVSGFLRNEGDNFIFAENGSAFLQPVANVGFKFSLWSGPDAMDIIETSPGNYTLIISKPRSITPEFVPEVVV
jgi:hypothetical protein